MLSIEGQITYAQGLFNKTKYIHATNLKCAGLNAMRALRR